MAQYVYQTPNEDVVIVFGEPGLPAQICSEVCYRIHNVTNRPAIQLSMRQIAKSNIPIGTKLNGPVETIGPRAEMHFWNPDSIQSVIDNLKTSKKSLVNAIKKWEKKNKSLKTKE